MCPNNGYDGYSHIQSCTEDSWKNAVVVVVVGSNMGSIFKDFDRIQDQNWGYGVFYGTDSNSADQRCRYLASHGGWDCPGHWVTPQGSRQDNSKGGAGGYPAGNPYAQGGGGGAGCHFKYSSGTMDQFDADGTNLVQDNDCQCNYALKGNGWQDWVNQWIYHGHSKSAFAGQEPWFAGGTKKAPSWAVDIAACWVNNPRDMIYIQNMIWFHRYDWSNQLVPQSSWNVNDAGSQRYYWGWNEVPVDAHAVNLPSNWDAIVIKLPAAICPGTSGGSDTIKCLSASAQIDLENQLDWYVQKSFLRVGFQDIGHRPGSYVVLLREWEEKTNTWQRYFFCENWNADKYKIVFNGLANQCYLDRGSGPRPSPPAPPPPPPCGGKPGRFMLASDNSKCMDIAGGKAYNGASVQLWYCNGMGQQNFKWCGDGRIVSELNENMCLDVPGGDPSKSQYMQLWTCNGAAGQYWEYDGNQMHIYPAKANQMCLDTANGGVTDGTKVNIYDCHGGGTQWFTKPNLQSVNGTGSDETKPDFIAV